MDPAEAESHLHLQAYGWSQRGCRRENWRVVDIVFCFLQKHNKFEYFAIESFARYLRLNQKDEEGKKEQRRKRHLSHSESSGQWAAPFIDGWVWCTDLSILNSFSWVDLFMETSPSNHHANPFIFVKSKKIDPTLHCNALL